MKADATTLLSRQRGTLPDMFWYQMNGKSAQENYCEQLEKIRADLAEGDEEIYITSEVKIK